MLAPLASLGVAAHTKISTELRPLANLKLRTRGVIAGVLNCELRILISVSFISRPQPSPSPFSSIIDVVEYIRLHSPHSFLVLQSSSLAVHPHCVSVHWVVGEQTLSNVAQEADASSAATP